MIKIQCDNCEKGLGMIIDTDLFICSECMYNKTETEIENMISKCKVKIMNDDNILEIIT